ncbi:MAG: hypothetical protein KJP00_07790 [Bacteroidia bacterium]|nr:hypothetical protein [Bacteroidia bacterium]
MEKNGIWEEYWKVAAFMVDTDQRIRLRSMADVFQELANNHANYWNVGFERMKSSGRFWVLNRQAIEFLTWPHWEQPLRVESWISMMKGPFSLRHFAAFNESDEVMVKASYLWTSIDHATKKPIAYPAGDFPIVEERDFDLPRPYKFRLSGEPIASQTYTVRDSDLDIIGHTNNAIYLEWVTNAIHSMEIDIQKIDANYVGESFLGEEIAITILGNEDGKHAATITNSKDLELFRMIIS